MKELIIVGASGLGKEVAWLAKRLGLEVSGFLDDQYSGENDRFYHQPILGRIDDWVKFEQAHFVIAIASPRIKEKLYKRMVALGNPAFATLIDPSVQIDSTETRVGEGTVICAGTVCTADTVIGSHCTINKLCSIGHDASIQDFVTLSPQVMLGGHTTIEQRAELGAASLIRQGLTVGSDALVGMGSVVTKSLPPGIAVVGNPAKELTTRHRQ